MPTTAKIVSVGHRVSEPHVRRKDGEWSNQRRIITAMFLDSLDAFSYAERKSLNRPQYMTYKGKVKMVFIDGEVVDVETNATEKTSPPTSTITNQQIYISNGVFILGKHFNELVEKVWDEQPQYIYGLLSRANLCNEDRKVLESCTSNKRIEEGIKEIQSGEVIWSEGKKEIQRELELGGEK